MITGVDLVALGIRVAAGEKLPIKQNEINIKGHAIEVRINAENSWTLEPSPGKIWECIWPGGQGVRVDSHAHTGYTIPSSFDSLIAKIICWAPTRMEAINKMSATLNEVILTGVDTLIPLHKKILKEKDFKNGDVTINYLEEHPQLMKEVD
jgi:acetyl-CoA carboxylase biotin carboxylase subunit